MIALCASKASAAHASVAACCSSSPKGERVPPSSSSPPVGRSPEEVRARRFPGERAFNSIVHADRRAARAEASLFSWSPEPRIDGRSEGSKETRRRWTSFVGKRDGSLVSEAERCTRPVTRIFSVGWRSCTPDTTRKGSSLSCTTMAGTGSTITTKDNGQIPPRRRSRCRTVSRSFHENEKQRKPEATGAGERETRSKKRSKLCCIAESTRLLQTRSQQSSRLFGAGTPFPGRGGGRDVPSTPRSS